MDTLFNRRG